MHIYPQFDHETQSVFFHFAEWLSIATALLSIALSARHPAQKNHFIGNFSKALIVNVCKWQLNNCWMGKNPPNSLARKHPQH